MSVTSAACGSSTPAPTGGSADAGHPDGAVSDAPTGDQLQILSLSTTVSTVTGGQPTSTETDMVTFIAIVTDTKGLDTIAGGQLIDNSGGTYAAFEAGTNKGTYTATLTFQQMNQVKALDFTDAGGTIMLTAKFFDNEAKVATSPVAIQLACRDATYGLEGACGGTCADPTIDFANCGTCGHACGTGTYCAAGTCQPAALDVNNQTSCIPARSIDHFSTCLDVCTAAGKNCDGSQFWDDASCALTEASYSCFRAFRDTVNPDFKGVVCGCAD